jgi:hypothetical protein
VRQQSQELIEVRYFYVVWQGGLIYFEIVECFAAASPKLLPRVAPAVS